MKIRCTAALGLGALAIALAGCGSSSSSSSTTASSSGSGGSAPTPAAYRSEVSKLCSAINARVTALPASTDSSIPGLKKLFVIDVNALTQVKAVPVPSSLQGQVRSWLGTVAQEEMLTARAIGQLEQGQAAQAQATARQGHALGERGNAEARALGLAPCAANPRPQGK